MAMPPALPWPAAGGSAPAGAPGRGPARRPGTQHSRRHAGPPPGTTATDAPSPGPAADVHPVARRSGAPPEAVGLLDQARDGLDEAAGLEFPNEAYTTAHLAALRTAAAVLAVRGRPESTERSRRRIRSAWEVLPEVAPELAEWGALFASGASRRARAEAGIRDAASRRDADDLIRDAGMFLRLVERLLALQPVLPHPREPVRSGPVPSGPASPGPEEAALRPGAD